MARPERQPELAALKALLREHQLRATTPRVAVLRVLMTARAPLTHAEVVGGLGGQVLDRATVYRNLVDLVQAGLAQRSDLGDHVWRFSYAGLGRGRPHAAHPHFVCSECGDVLCLPAATVAVSGARGVPRALRRRDVQIQIRGLCDRCEP